MGDVPATAEAYQSLLARLQLRVTPKEPREKVISRLFELVERFSSTRVALFGDLVLDRYVLGTPKRISREAPVIILRHEEQRDFPDPAVN